MAGAADFMPVTAPGGEASAGKRTSGRFQKGRSGNPGGRPRDLDHVRELARGYGPDAIKTLKTIMVDAKVAAAARVSAACALLDRGYGKPMQAIENTLMGANGLPITPTIVLSGHVESGPRNG
jgi:hypothetical protein